MRLFNWNKTKKASNLVDLSKGFDILVRYNSEYDIERLIKCTNIIIEYTTNFTVKDLQELLYTKKPLDDSTSNVYRFNTQMGLYITKAANKILASETDIIRLDLLNTNLNFLGYTWRKGILELTGNLGNFAADSMNNGLIYVNGKVGKYACNEMRGGIFLAKHIESFDKYFSNGIISSEKFVINKARPIDINYRDKIMPYLNEKIKEEVIQTNSNALFSNQLIVSKEKIKV